VKTPSKNIHRYEPTSVTSQFHADFGNILEKSIFNEDIVFLRDAIVTWWRDNKDNLQRAHA